jgi:ADP-heptose:LPS heptosyltransferase/GT2 family glycosyltransferase
VRGDALARAGLDLPAMAAAGEYAALLRLTEAATTIRHVPQLVLQARRSHEAAGPERRALSQALRRRDIAGTAEAGRKPELHRVKRDLGPTAKISIIIPTIAAKGHVSACIDSIRRLTTGIDYEIIIVDNLRGRSPTPEQSAWKAWFQANADIVVPADEAFNWSKLNNRGAAAASGDYLLFLNDDIEVQHGDWLAVLAAEAARPEVGVVGAQLLYPDGKVQHAGMVLSRVEIGSASHAFRFADKDDPGYFGLALSQRNVACVTGACMMMRSEVFAEAGGFNEAHSIVNNDVDFCLRQHSAGMLIVYTPHVQLIHHELASRAELKDSYDKTVFRERWGELCLEGDPFHNRNLDGEAEAYAIDEEPLREVYAGHPLGQRDRIRRILAVKLDHIGDLVTALPALRRLKAHFPQARLDALVGPSAIGIARLEAAIDDIIPFAFFEARSSLGRKTLRKQHYAALEAGLKARRYDLAVDLRKLGDTRQILQLTHAPVLAGFDHDRSFPWLDIALEWEGDALQARKRNHVAGDLLNLVDAVGNAFDEDRRTIRQDSALPTLSAELVHDSAGLFARDYVVVHPAAGTALRQWPPAYFARLIDLLVERDGMRVGLIGGPDERDIAGEVLGGVKHADAVFDLVGSSRLADLPEILARSVLFVGNNSGPSHIASGLGVPTVSVHSAIVASEEWGPLGPAAVALRRDMSCAPCYIVDVDQCHRGMVCLTSITPDAVHALCQRFLSLRADPGSHLKTADHRANEEPHGCDA